MRPTSIYVSCTAIALAAVACGEAQNAAELNARLGGSDSPIDGFAPGPSQPQQGDPNLPLPALGATEDEQPATDDGQGAGQPVSEEGQQPVALDTPGGDEPAADAPSAGDEPESDGDEPVVIDADPYAPRSGSFRMLVYSRTTGYRHDSIVDGREMLRQIANEQGFEVTETETNDLITPEGLAQFEIVFFMNSTGDIFNETEELAFQDWMENHDGAWAGTHSATDTEQGWVFYKDVTGQYFNDHGPQNAPGAVQFEADMLDFPALRGIPNPWQRNEEWYNFNSFQQWSTQPGFMVLGRKQADNQPIMWARELNNWRSFYTALGHDSAVFRDPLVKQHVAGGILWTVRRDHLLPN